MNCQSKITNSGIKPSVTYCRLIKGHKGDCLFAAIKTECQNPPIPIRNLDWLAYLDPEFGPFGHGATEQAAIDDLKEVLDA